jgi:DNA-binding response OmpR family regulator
MLNAPAAPSRILVVEDEVLIQMLAADYLAELGLQAEIAGSAAEAKKMLLGSDARFEAAIVDMGLPDAKGNVVMEQLRAVNPHLSIIVASGEDEASIRERFKGDNSIMVLSKPYTVDQLRSVLRSVGVLD